MSEVEAFRAVPTVFPAFNRASQVGGAPLSCVYLVHGPPGHGKTAWLCGLIQSFQLIGGLTSLVDAELAADTHRWFRTLGVDARKCLYIGRTGDAAKEKPKPLTYEETVDEVQGQLERFRAGKKEGVIAPGTPFLLAVDSISKLIPSSVLKGLDGDDGGAALSKGVGRLQAMLNTAWLAALGPTVGDDDIVFLVIAHEMEGGGGNRSWDDFKVRGGNGVVYDSMVQLRVTYAGKVTDLAADGSPMTGKKHRVKFLRNKHGRAYEEAVFFTSTGVGVAPMGFDRPREVVHEALLRELIKGPALKNGTTTLTLGTRLERGSETFTLAQLYEPDRAVIVDELGAELDGTLLEAEAPDDPPAAPTPPPTAPPPPPRVRRVRT